ncbi:uncharacterized protein LOC141729661 isoform X1 [Zonotrichia albicollis]|uniref:uncharacterized protein LOC141729661 isoform X1 n=1 Tax=Zonotrichia albicollis TaxID=44394 RepID=UPI003D811E04
MLSDGKGSVQDILYGKVAVRDMPGRRWHPGTGAAAAELGGGSSPGCHQRGCKAVPEAELPNDLPRALLMSREQGAVCSRQRDGACEQEESEICSIPVAANEPWHVQEGPAAAVPHFPGAQEASWHKQGDATCERAASADVENGFCTSDGSVTEPLAPQGTAATGNECKRTLRRLLGERFRSHPVGTAVLILLLLVLVLALGAAVAVLAAPQVPVTPVTLLLVLGCPMNGWATMGSATTSHRITARGIRVRNGAPSSMPPWPLPRMRRPWICSPASLGTSITGSGCADGASACSGGTAAATAPGFLSSAIPTVCTWLRGDSKVTTAPVSGRMSAARPKLRCNRGCTKDLLHAGQCQLHL